MPIRIVPVNGRPHEKRCICSFDACGGKVGSALPGRLTGDRKMCDQQEWYREGTACRLLMRRRAFFVGVFFIEVVTTDI